MAQIIPYLGTRNLESAATGLGTGLQELASRKLSQMQQRERASELSKLLQATKRYSPEEANLIGSLGEKNFAEHAQMFQGGYQPDIQKPSQNQQNILPEASEIDSLQQRLKALQSNRPEELTTSNLSSLFANQKAKELGLPTEQSESPFDLSKINGRDLLAQAAANGINLSPEQQQKAVAKLEALQADKNQLATIQNDLNSYMQRQQQQLNKPSQPQPEQQFYRKPSTASQKSTELHQIKMENQKELEPLNKMIGLADEGLRILNNIESELDSGHVYTGAIVGKTPISLLNQYSQETQDVARNLENYLTLKQGILKGNPSKYRVEILEKGKPSLSLSIDNLKKAIREEKEPLQNIKNLQEIRQKLIDRNEGNEPRNLAYHIEKEAQIRNKSQVNKSSHKLSVGQLIDDRPKNPKKGMQILNNSNEVEEWNGKDWIIKE